MAILYGEIEQPAPENHDQSDVAITCFITFKSHENVARRSSIPRSAISLSQLQIRLRLESSRRFGQRLLFLTLNCEPILVALSKKFFPFSSAVEVVWNFELISRCRFLIATEEAFAYPPAGGQPTDNNIAIRTLIE